MTKLHPSVITDLETETYKLPETDPHKRTLEKLLAHISIITIENDDLREEIESVSAERDQFDQDLDDLRSFHQAAATC